MRRKSNPFLPYVPSYDHDRSLKVHTQSIRSLAEKEGGNIPCTDGEPAFDENHNLTSSAYRDIMANDAEKVLHITNALSTGVYEPDPDKKIIDVMYSQTYPEIFNAAVELFVRERVYP